MCVAKIRKGMSGMCKRFLSLTVMLVFIMTLCASPARAAVQGLDTHELSEEEKTAVIQNTNLKVLENDSYQSGIKSFDVDTDGSYALAMGEGSNCCVYVYDPQGVFRYGFGFSCDGAYAVRFHGDALALFFLRGNTVSVYDASATCVNAYRVTDSSMNDSRVRKLLDRIAMVADGKQYLLERDMEIGNSYSRLVCVSESGGKTVLYDISSQHSLGQGGLLIAALGFVLVVIVGMCRKCRKEYR